MSERYYLQDNIPLFIAEMMGLAKLVLLLIGLNTILSLSLPVIEGDIHSSQGNLYIFSSEDDALDLQKYETEPGEPQFDFLQDGKFVHPFLENSKNYRLFLEYQ